MSCNVRENYCYFVDCGLTQGYFQFESYFKFIVSMPIVKSRPVIKLKVTMVWSVESKTQHSDCDLRIHI